MCLRHPATGKEDCAWPLYFPSSWREALHGGQGAGPGEAFEANVDSLHILSGRPWGASRKMLRSPGRAQGLSERQRVQTRSESTLPRQCRRSGQSS